MIAGRNALFIPGPTNLPDRLRRAMDVPLEDQRAPDFPDFALGLFADMKQVFKTERGQIFIFPGSGTGAWEAAITNTLSPGDKVLAARFGQFSHLWIDLCQRHKLDLEIVEVPWARACRSRPMPGAWPPTRRTRSRRSWSATTRPRPASPAT